ncbi:Exodeoxyribonuclease 7 large subunit [Sesbania bispinosa]|nr:Exodeoxyribonuclease 7 large subunit [Sesbania bispinosa]
MANVESEKVGQTIDRHRRVAREVVVGHIETIETVSEAVLKAMSGWKPRLLEACRRRKRKYEVNEKMEREGGVAIVIVAVLQRRRV